ncbi:MAG: CpaD family pilus assembly lipoprotein [Alphaproteobacteria bacterium]
MDSSIRRATARLLVGTLFGALAACASVTEEDLAVNETPKKLEVEWARKTHLVDFEPNKAELAENTKAELAAFLDRAYAGPDDFILINPGETWDDRRAVFAARGRAVQNFISDLGYRSEILPSRSEDEGFVIVAVEHYDVRVPTCPDWRRNPPLTNGVSSNFGCTDAVNLGLMLADPRDLVTGRELGAMDGIPAAAAVERYRKGEVKELEVEATSDEGNSE